MSKKISSRFQDYSVATVSNVKIVAQNILKSIKSRSEVIGESLRIMHVCGTHEATVARSGMRSLLPKSIRVISGPGCPVCICPSEHISTAIALAEQGSIVVTFGDMFKVPDGNLVTLSQAKAKGNDIRLVYSVTDAINIAREHEKTNVVWLGVGFETTAPMTSFVLEQGVPENFFVLSDFRLVPPAMHILSQDTEFDLNAFILPGHVSTIIGTDPYEDFPNLYHIPCVVAGFDPLDFLVAMDKTLKQIEMGETKVENAYPRVVKKEGNKIALKSMANAFQIIDAKWRGVGIIPNSGYELHSRFDDHNARNLLDEPIPITQDLPPGCQCGKVILGQVEPESCRHFLKRCTPETAIGPCMVSDEGTCRIRAKYIDIGLEVQ
ncbi:MAG: hydrogenase formation protein HypD [Candidatus Kariarchaeaceae archaeon]|jgi:hydrogenase expression/formation protein HypD